MKKQYTAPEMEVVNIKSLKIICVSFGDGETNIMHTRRRDRSDEDDDLMWDE